MIKEICESYLSAGMRLKRTKSKSGKSYTTVTQRRNARGAWRTIK